MIPQIQSFLDKVQSECATFEQQKAIYSKCPYSVTKIRDILHKPFDKEKSAQRTFAKNFDNPDSDYYHMSVEEIIAEWERRGEFGKANGKSLDKFTELVLEKKESDDILEKYMSSLNDVANRKCHQFLKFCQDNIDGKLEFVGRELMLYDDVHGVNGRLDALFMNKNNLILIDWKNDKEISLENSYEKCKGPLYKYDACDLNLYTVQLYTYVYMLRKIYHLDNLGIIPLVVRIGEYDYGIYSPIIPYSDSLIENTILYAIDKINIQREL